MSPDVAVPAVNVTETDRGTRLFVAVDELVYQCSGQTVGHCRHGHLSMRRERARVCERTDEISAAGRSDLAIKAPLSRELACYCSDS